MIPDVSERVLALKARLEDFMRAHIYPNEERFYREAEGTRSVEGLSGR
jgi:acyl-CoA dehydrogenase